MRFAVVAALLVPVCVLVGRLVERREPVPTHDREMIAQSWANTLMQDSSLTQYGWVPSDAQSEHVDKQLERQGAAFILLDPERRVVSASERLSIRSAVLRLGADGFVEVPPLGRVRVTRAKVRVFGSEQGEFLLLSRKPTATLSRGPAEVAPVAAGVPGSQSIGSVALLVAALLAGFCSYGTAHFVVSRRLLALTSVAWTAGNDVGAPRRFSAGGGDEIRALADALNTMRKRTQRHVGSMRNREDRRRDWLSELSHDLRTPLAALRIRLDNSSKAETVEDLRMALRTAIDDCERIQKLAAGFIDLAELEVTEDFVFEPVMPEELIGQALRGLRPIAEDARVAVETDVAPQETILADGHRLLRALENTLRNAIRHAKSKVIVGVEADGDEVRFFIRDDGDGFPEMKRDEPTEYAAWRGRRQAGGLGLRVVERVARAHGGRLVLESRANGTEVFFTVAAGGGV